MGEEDKKYNSIPKNKIENSIALDFIGEKKK